MNDWKDFKACPHCRGYWLERQWCSQCGGSGLIKIDRRDSAAHTFELLRENKQ